MQSAAARARPIRPKSIGRRESRPVRVSRVASEKSPSANGLLRTASLCKRVAVTRTLGLQDVSEA